MTSSPSDVPVSPGMPHTRAENLFGLASGCLTMAIGIFILKAAGVATGGIAGLALLLTYATGWAFGLIFVAVSIPFFVIGLIAKGWSFTLRSIATVCTVAALSWVNDTLFTDFTVEPFYGSILGNVLAGSGLLILFRHGASLGGFGILALLVQERFGWSAGYVQLVFDGLIVLAAFWLLTPLMVLASLIGAVVFAFVLSMNHRPGRYTGY